MRAKLFQGRVHQNHREYPKNAAGGCTLLLRLFYFLFFIVAWYNTATPKIKPTLSIAFLPQKQVGGRVLPNGDHRAVGHLTGTLGTHGTMVDQQTRNQRWIHSRVTHGPHSLENCFPSNRKSMKFTLSLSFSFQTYFDGADMPSKRTRQPMQDPPCHKWQRTFPSEDPPAARPVRHFRCVVSIAAT